MAVARKSIAPDATVNADEASHWDQLAANFPIKRINHKIAYSADGACTNQAESFFSRLRRARLVFITASPAAIWRLTLLNWLGAKMPVGQQGNQFTMIVSAAAVDLSQQLGAGHWQRRSGLTLGS